MKKIKLLFIASLFSLQAMAQAPQSFNYQSVVRTNTGALIANQNVSFRFSVLQGSAAGSTVYSETHTLMTNDFGLANLQVGTGTVVSGSMASIDWGTNSYFLQVELDPAGGSTYAIMGTSQLVSVPYALHAHTADNVDDADADPANEIQTLSTSGTSVSISSGNSVDMANVIPKTTISKMGNMNDMFRAITAPFTWTRVSPEYTFTKNNAGTTMEMLLQARVGVGNFTGGAFGCYLTFVVDGVTGFPALGTYMGLTVPNNNEFRTFSSFFDALPAGTHTVAIYGYTNGGGVDDIIFDAGGIGGCVLVKESW